MDEVDAIKEFAGVITSSPALIPASMNRINPQKGQSYKIKVVGRDYGLLVVEKIEKS